MQVLACKRVVEVDNHLSGCYLNYLCGHHSAALYRHRNDGVDGDAAIELAILFEQRARQMAHCLVVVFTIRLVVRNSEIELSLSL